VSTELIGISDALEKFQSHTKIMDTIFPVQNTVCIGSARWTCGAAESSRWSTEETLAVFLTPNKLFRGRLFAMSALDAIV